MRALFGWAFLGIAAAANLQAGLEQTKGEGTEQCHVLTAATVASDSSKHTQGKGGSCASTAIASVAPPALPER